MKKFLMGIIIWIIMISLARAEDISLENTSWVWFSNRGITAVYTFLPENKGQCMTFSDDRAVLDLISPELTQEFQKFVVVEFFSYKLNGEKLEVKYKSNRRCTSEIKLLRRDLLMVRELEINGKAVESLVSKDEINYYLLPKILKKIEPVYILFH